MRLKMDFKSLKQKGNSKYKTGSVEPVDLFISGKMFRDFALASIIKYAFRNRSEVSSEINKSDLEKIIHYAELLLANY